MRTTGRWIFVAVNGDDVELVTMRATWRGVQVSTRRWTVDSCRPMAPATCGDLRGAAERKACAAAERERCFEGQQTGMVASTSSLSGWVAHAGDYGCDEVVEHFLAHAMRTSSPRVCSRLRRREELVHPRGARPFSMTGISDLSFTLPGMPMRPVLGCGWRPAAGRPARSRRVSDGSMPRPSS